MTSLNEVENSLDANRQRTTGQTTSSAGLINPWEESTAVTEVVAPLADLSTEEPSEVPEYEIPVISDDLPEFDQKPDKPFALKGTVATSEPSAKHNPHAVDVVVEDLFNGVINALGDGLEFAIGGTGKASRLLGEMTDRAMSRVMIGAAAAEKTLSRMTNRNRRKSFQDDETGLE